jgi:hypothetical protein
METLDIVKQYQFRAKEFALEYEVDNEHIISIIASVMMTRDKVGPQGGGFVQAVVNNDLFNTISRADIQCYNNLKVIVAAHHYCYLD